MTSRPGAGADLGEVFGEGDIAYPVKPILDRPLASDDLGQPGGADVVEGQVGDGVDGFALPSPSSGGSSAAGDPDGQLGVGEGDPAVLGVDDGQVQGAGFEPSVPVLGGLIGHRDIAPREPG